MSTTRAMGWRRDAADPRDWRLALPTDEQLAALPEAVDLSPSCGPVYDQGPLSSCTAHVVTAAHRYVQARMGLAPWAPSRLFNYYTGRQIDLETWPGPLQDAGLTIRAGIQAAVRQGICPESVWRYTRSAVNRQPTPSAYANALRHQATVYWRVAQTSDAMRAALAQGYPICLGVMVYRSFLSAAVERTGDVPMPRPAREALAGAHALLVTGYAGDRAIVRNSWGTGWGRGGHGTIPLAYLANPALCADLWSVRLVER